ARRRGDRRWETTLRTGCLIQLVLLGRWNEALSMASEEQPRAASDVARVGLLAVGLVHCERGEAEPARALLAAHESIAASDNRQTTAGYELLLARVLRAEGRNADALATAERVLALRAELSILDLSVKSGLVEAVEAALELGDLDKAGELLAIADSLDPGDL